MKETAKLRKRYRSTAKYYKIMKEVRICGFVEVKIMKEGSAAIMKELRAVKDGLKNAEFTDDTYPSLKARENIVHQFEAIQTKRELVVLLCRSDWIGTLESLEFRLCCQWNRYSCSYLPYSLV